jgi:SH3-like domain-containing protein
MKTSMFGTLFCGVQQYLILNDTSGLLVGTHPWRDLFSLDVTQLPGNTEEAIAGLDREGWAVVNNPDPADRLHLRAGPETSAESLGKFYNRTPVRVLERRDGWARVRIGADGRLEGWMMEKFLAFGSAMDAVASASPNLTLREEYAANNPIFASPDMRETTGVYYGYGMWIAGAVGDELYIMLDTEGNTGFLPQSWFWAGNG